MQTETYKQKYIPQTNIHNLIKIFKSVKECATLRVEAIGSKSLSPLLLFKKSEPLM